METFELKCQFQNGKQTILEAIHNDNFEDRKGYNQDFLNKTVPLPKLKNPSDNLDIAINQNVGENGKNYLDYTHFSLMFNKNKKMPFFTAVNIDGQTNALAKVHEKRTSDSWFQDKRIVQENNTYQYNNEDYKDSGFQKGHMVRFYDPAWGVDESTKKTAIGDTFHYTNCCPQIGKYNAGVWNDLEDYYMARTIFQDRKISVFSGPVFNKAMEINNLLVPINYWKVIVYNSEKSIEALGFLISQELGFKRMVHEQLIVEKKTVKPTLTKADINRLFNKNNLKQWVVKISLIEEKTGIDFGLNGYDIKANESQYFYQDVINYQNDSDLRQKVGNSNKKIYQKLKEMRHLMDFSYFRESTDRDDFTEFIKNI